MLRAFLAVTFTGALAVTACASTEPASPMSANANLGPVTSEPAVDARPVPTFHGDVEAIYQRRCQSCHHAGGIAPFALVDYRAIIKGAATHLDRMQTGKMPPWGAYDDDTCKIQHTFKQDLRMQPSEIDTVRRWVEGGMPEGDAAQAPHAPPFAGANLANATDTFQIPTPYKVEPGKDDIRCFPIDPKLTADTWIAGVNVVPGDPRVVHHVIVYTDPHGQGPAKADPATGSYPCFGGPKVDDRTLLLAWAPGVPAVDYGGSEAALKIPKGSGLVMQVHYHPAKTATTDQTKFELRRLSTKPRLVAQVLLAGNASSANGRVKLLPGADDPASGPAFVIPSNARQHVESMELTMPETVSGFPLPPLRIATIGAHMHLAGVDMKIEIERKTPKDNPAKECLLGTPKYDFNWQRGYAYDAPYEQLPLLGAGDTLRFTCTYDNTTENEHIRKAMAEDDRRPAQPPEIHLGEETFDEMCLGAILFLRDITPFD